MLHIVWLNEEVCVPVTEILLTHFKPVLHFYTPGKGILAWNGLNKETR